MMWYSAKNSESRSASRLPDPREAADEELRRDQALASEFQQAFLSRPYPQIPAIHVPGRLRLVFAHSYQPAMAVGGDFFNIEAVGPDAAGVFVADVMGHGTRSALITAILRTLLNELQPQGRNASHFLRLINQRFCSLLRGLPFTFFASACYLVADTTARVATFATAGHPPPFFLRRHLGEVSRVGMPAPRGAALGVMPELEFGALPVRIQHGDGFIFFTDGLYEVMNAEGEEFGLQRVEEVLRANIYKPGQEILDALRAAVRGFVGPVPPHDDICVVSADVTSAPLPQPSVARN